MDEDNQNEVASNSSAGGGMGIKTIVSWIIILLVIAGGIFLLTNDENEYENDSEDDEMGVMEDGVMTDEEMKAMEDGDTAMGDDRVMDDGKNVITYTSSGFSPNEITIKKGESVTFVNESGSGMWVGSAMHPTHKNYPIKSEGDCLGSSFDQCESTNNGTEWTFTFEAEGEHGYHNHVKSNHWGKVIVE
jgi:plastocyanin